MKELTDKEFSTLRDYIKENYGISLGNEKKSLLYSRLRSVLVEKNIKDFTEYYQYLINDRTGEAATQFIDKITTNHTFFMREVDHFYYFRDTVLPYIEQTDKNKDARVWCAASSSGEEPYTLQMFMRDYFKGKDGWNTDMLATDISTNVLSKAVKGVYSNESIEALQDSWKKNYFKPFDESSSIISDEIKKHVAFRRFNLMTEQFPFKKKFQTIFCRNVMIYFDNKTRDELVKRFYEVTEPGGYLFIGHSESLNHTDTEYKYIMPALYRRMQ